MIKNGQHTFQPGGKGSWWIFKVTSLGDELTLEVNA